MIVKTADILNEYLLLTGKDASSITAEEFLSFRKQAVSEAKDGIGIDGETVRKTELPKSALASAKTEVKNDTTPNVSSRASGLKKEAPAPKPRENVILDMMKMMQG